MHFLYIFYSLWKSRVSYFPIHRGAPQQGYYPQQYQQQQCPPTYYQPARGPVPQHGAHPYQPQQQYYHMQHPQPVAGQRQQACAWQEGEEGNETMVRCMMCILVCMNSNLQLTAIIELLAYVHMYIYSTYAGQKVVCMYSYIQSYLMSYLCTHACTHTHTHTYTNTHKHTHT